MRLRRQVVRLLYIAAAAAAAAFICNQQQRLMLSVSQADELKGRRHRTRNWAGVDLPPRHQHCAACSQTLRRVFKQIQCVSKVPLFIFLNNAVKSTDFSNFC